jgi:hypothetical protein
MPIPPLQEDGLLPPGLYVADMNEIEERFGKSTPRRSELFARLHTFVELARHCGALRMFINGSFVTAKPEPGDVDVVIWLSENYYELLKRADKEAIRLEEMFDTREPAEAFSVFEELDWNEWIDFFSLVREYPNKRKGLVEVKLA